MASVLLYLGIGKNDEYDQRGKESKEESMDSPGRAACRVLRSTSFLQVLPAHRRRKSDPVGRRKGSLCSNARTSETRSIRITPFCSQYH